MAKKLTKALRGKRRWVGVIFKQGVDSRDAANKIVNSLKQELGEGAMLKLMDFYPHGHEVRDAAQTQSELLNDWGPGCGVGVLQVSHPHSQALREILSTGSSLEDKFCLSLTMSGKIRLVRERLALPNISRK